MTKLYLVRHGETIDNVNQVMQGQTQGLLNEKGIRQAEELAAQMADMPIDAFVSSDLKRAYDTCKIIANKHGNDVDTTPLLRERDWGDFTGMFIPDLKDKEWPPNVESMGMLKDRARRFLEWVRKNYQGKVVLAVGHGIINKAIQSVYYNKPMHEVKKMTNAEVRELML